MSARRGHGEGSVYFEEQRQRWVAVVEVRSPDGKRSRRKVTGKSKRDVQQRLKALQERQARGLPLPNRQLTVGQWLTYWTTEVLPHDDHVRPATADSYGYSVRKYLVPAIGKVRLVDLAPAHVRRMLDDLATGGLAPTSLRYVRAVLSKALSVALEEEYVSRNVAQIVRPPRLDKAPGDGPVNIEDALTAEQASQVLEAAQGHPLHALWTLLIGTGIRPSEALGLRWAHVDLKEGSLEVVVSLRRRTGVGLVLNETKRPSHKRRLLLPESVRQALRVHRKAQAAMRLAAGEGWIDDRGWVFCTSSGHPQDWNNAARSWRKLCIKAKVPPCRPYVTRHTAATLMLEAGVPLETVSTVLGHSSHSFTADVYARVRDAGRADAAAAMDRVLAKRTKPEGQ